MRLSVELTETSFLIEFEYFTFSIIMRLFAFSSSHSNCQKQVSFYAKSIDGNYVKTVEKNENSNIVLNFRKIL